MSPCNPSRTANSFVRALDMSVRGQLLEAARAVLLALYYNNLDAQIPPQACKRLYARACDHN